MKYGESSPAVTPKYCQIQVLKIILVQSFLEKTERIYSLKRSNRMYRKLYDKAEGRGRDEEKG